MIYDRHHFGEIIRVNNRIAFVIFAHKILCVSIVYSIYSHIGCVEVGTTLSMLVQQHVQIVQNIWAMRIHNDTHVSVVSSG